MFNHNFNKNFLAFFFKNY